mgnify:CR=1 FL=1
MANNSEMTEAEIEQVEDIETLKQALIEEKNKVEKFFASWQRTQADLDNYVKRAEQEKSEIVEFASRTLILNLLPILDDFDRAFASLPAELDDSSWTEGIKLIYNKLTSILEAQGLAEIKAKGEYFDPYHHEAAGQLSGEEGIIIEEIRKGYKFKNKLLRPSMVMVGKGTENKTREES